MMGLERAFRTDAHHPTLEKVYLSFQCTDTNRWRATNLHPDQAKAAERRLVALFGPSLYGFALHAKRAYAQHCPVRLIQGTFSGTHCTRVKLYHAGPGVLPATTNALRTHPTMAKAADRGGLELSGLVWPDDRGVEIYTQRPDKDSVPAPVRRAMAAHKAPLCQTGHDTTGTSTWYFAAQGCPPATALRVLEHATGHPTSAWAHARIRELCAHGWQWADVIVQSTPNALVPVAHLVHPHPNGHAFRV